MEARMHAEILRRYDEVLSEKASKFNLLELEDNLRKQAARLEQIKLIEKRVENVQQKAEKMRKDNEMRFDYINSSLSVEIMNAVKKALRQQGLTSRT